MKRSIARLVLLIIWTMPLSGWAWHDEPHLSIAKAAGYEKWYNAAGADITKIKAGNVEKKNQYVNNPPGTTLTPDMVLKQAGRYNKSLNLKGHLYGAIIASIREYHI